MLTVNLRIIGEITGGDDRKENRADAAANEALDRLVWRERDQFCATKGLAEHVCHGVVDHYGAIRHEQPKVALVHIKTQEHRATDGCNGAHDIPGELLELVSVLALLQIECEADEPEEKETAAYHDVVLEEYSVENSVSKLEVNHAFGVLEQNASHEQVWSQHKKQQQREEPLKDFVICVLRIESVVTGDVHHFAPGLEGKTNKQKRIVYVAHVVTECHRREEADS